MNRVINPVLAGIIITIMMMITIVGVRADAIEILKVEVQKSGDQYRFSVTLKHPDTGWDHYANEWQVKGPDGTIYGTRILAHPHVDEQPFTRSLGGINIPDGVSEVEVVAGDNLGHRSAEPYKVKLPQ